MTKKREPGPFKRIWCKKLRWATRMLSIVCLMIPSLEGLAQVKRVTLEARDLPVNEVLRMLGKEYGKEFFFSDTQVDMQQRVSVSLDNRDDCVRAGQGRCRACSNFRGCARRGKTALAGRDRDD